ncbi:MAG: glucosamine-6-phosphate deaminase [Lentisphaeria bacterium]|nr:glucosamine-6-phosphate deaminase [Lentisphaeria bacterium]
MKWTAVDNYDAMSEYGAEIIFQEVAAACREKRPFNLGLATGNTMLTLYRLLAEKLNAAKCDLSQLHTWNLDEYANDGVAVPESHPLSYRRYMKENFFNRLDPALGFTDRQYHFPDPEDPAGFDQALADAGNLDLQLLGIGFNGHIAFNEPMSPDEISKEEFAELPTRLIALKEMTIATNKRLTAGGEDIVPRQAATMGMKQILQAKKMLLLACFPEQQVPLSEIRNGRIGPDLPASYLAEAADSEIVWTKDVIDL